MPDDDRVAATLSGIRERAGIFAKLGPPRPARGFGNEIVNAAFASAEDAPALLAAVEAALELTVEWKQIPFAVRASDECADELREAITAALTGEEAGDGN